MREKAQRPPTPQAVRDSCEATMPLLLYDFVRNAVGQSATTHEAGIEGMCLRNGRLTSGCLIPVCSASSSEMKQEGSTGSSQR
jgi:hypothetical protein